MRNVAFARLVLAFRCVPAPSLRLSKNLGAMAAATELKGLRTISVCVTCGPYKSAGRFRRVGRSDPDLQTSDQQASLAHTLVATLGWMLLLPLAAACSLLVSSGRPAAYHHQHAPQQACVAAVCQRHHQRSADTPAVSSPYKQHAFASISFAHTLGHVQRAYIAQTFVYQVQRVRPIALTRLPLLS